MGWAGTTVVRVVAAETTTSDAGCPPTLTVVPPTTKLVPEIVTFVPPL